MDDLETGVPYIKSGHFVKAGDGQIYRLVSVSLDGVDPKLVSKVKDRLKQEDARAAGSAVRYATPDDEGFFISPDEHAGFDKDKDTP